MGTHPSPEPLGWQAWSATPSFLLRGGQKLPVLTVFLVMREQYWNSFQWANTMPWIDLASEDTTAVWTCSSICYLCERDEVRLAGVTSWVTAERVNQSPRPIGGICPLQRSNSSSSQFCSSLIIKCPLRDKMKMWGRQKFPKWSCATGFCAQRDRTNCLLLWSVWKSLSYYCFHSFSRLQIELFWFKKIPHIHAKMFLFHFSNVPVK